MPIIFDTTLGGVAANSYSTVEEADAYHLNHLYGDAWIDADTDVKQKALMLATRLLDENAVWIGSQTSITQGLGWPRSGALSRGGYLIVSTVIPAAVKWATAEFARLLITAGALPNTPGDIPAGLTALRAGSVALEFDANLTNVAKNLTDPIPSGVWAMISFLVETRSMNMTSVPLVRR